MTDYLSYYFSLSVSYSECQYLYTHQLFSVLLIAENGAKVQIPVNNLKRHIDSRGLKGRFRLLTDLNHKIISFERLS